MKNPVAITLVVVLAATAFVATSDAQPPRQALVESERGVPSSREQVRPNVILVLTDDQGYGDLSCHGNPILKTPNLDRMYDESMRFTDFHGGTAFLEDRIKQTHSYVMTERWRLLSGTTLYDIDADPAQRKDVAADHPGVVARLRALYEPYWESVLPRMKPVRIDLGSPEENPVSLCSQDWYMSTGNPPWNFRMIGKLPRVTAPWIVDVKRPGRYRLTLRQFPARAEKPVVAVRAKVRIAGLERECAVEPSSTGVVFEMDLPVGPTKLLTFLYDEKGRAGGAYFTEVEAL